MVGDGAWMADFDGGGILHESAVLERGSIGDEDGQDVRDCLRAANALVLSL